ncbi:MAG: hypothetical protein U9R11_02270 [Chloroflexota bacterium]|nr:hypothetical protein [Chloroflexota bacterium]
MELVRKEALAHVRAGADIFNVNGGVACMDEVGLLPQAVQAAIEVVDVLL